MVGLNSPRRADPFPQLSYLTIEHRHAQKLSSPALCGRALFARSNRPGSIGWLAEFQLALSEQGVDRQSWWNALERVSGTRGVGVGV
jgi:hypothetical protein